MIVIKVGSLQRLWSGHLADRAFEGCADCGGDGSDTETFVKFRGVMAHDPMISPFHHTGGADVVGLVEYGLLVDAEHPVAVL
jgi:hypothetical protein